MSRHNSGGSYDHRCHYDSPDLYRISWFVDYYYSMFRGRYPRLFERWTDEKGAKRFCKKWDLKFGGD